MCLGVHKRRSGKLAAPQWGVHFGSTKAQTTHKIVLHQVRRAKTNQRDSKSEFNFEPEGREFESLRARHIFVSDPETLGVLPLGTLNHFAKDMHIPQELEGAARNVITGRGVPVDVGEINGHIFLNNSSLGVYPRIVLLRREEE